MFFTIKDSSFCPFYFLLGDYLVLKIGKHSMLLLINWGLWQSGAVVLFLTTINLALVFLVVEVFLINGSANKPLKQDKKQLVLLLRRLF